MSNDSRDISEMQCKCDLDNWEPDDRTGHSWVCPIHDAMLNQKEVRNE